jgi:NAD-dependent deacetylase sirtuin 5
MLSRYQRHILSARIYPKPTAHTSLTIIARMASSTAPQIPPADLASFTSHLQSSTYILALLGAGLSASSGLPTFRGAGGLWRSHDATTLATPDAFDDDPALVWQFYSYRRHMALRARPNRAHYALAELARRKEGFLTLSQNVDGTYVRGSVSQHGGRK